MSQQLVPLDGGVQKVETTPSQSNLRVLSAQFISLRGLEEQPTQWVPGGRPIYRRLPGTCETYQVDFFNTAPAKNTAVAVERERIGYVYIPWGSPPGAPNTLSVSASESKQDLLIKGGVIVWEYGNTEVLPVIVNLEVLDVYRGSYELAYQLIYDDSPLKKLYEVQQFSLSGQPLNITSSTDSVVGWRYPAVNAFTFDSGSFWSNKDTFFPSYAQPTSSYIRWSSDLPSSYSKITLRCPANTAYTGTATLSYFSGSSYTFVQSVNVGSDKDGQLFEFTVDPRFQTGWQVEFSSLDISIQSISVSGVVTLMEKQSEPSSRSSLVMYPVGALPEVTVNGSGAKVPATYCPLAIVDIGVDYNVEHIEDTRYIIKRDYQPVSDWLTRPFDEDLINLYEQVSEYPSYWMNPTSCLVPEYPLLEKYQIKVEA